MHSYQNDKTTFDPLGFRSETKTNCKSKMHLVLFLRDVGGVD